MPKKLLSETLKSISQRKEAYQRQYERYSQMDSLFDLTLGLLNFLTISSLYMGGMEKRIPAFLIASTVLSTVAGLVLVVQKSFGSREKASQSKVSAKEYLNLLRETNVKLARKHLGREDYIQMLAELDQTLSVIEDHSPILTFEHLAFADELLQNVKNENENGNGHEIIVIKEEKKES